MTSTSLRRPTDPPMGRPQPHPRGIRPVQARVSWGWVLLALAALAAAVTVSVLNSGTCSHGDCRVAVAGGPIGWFAVGMLLVQAVWALVIAVRPAPQD